MAGIVLKDANVSDEERAAHTQALMEKGLKASLQRAADAKARLGDGKLKEALNVDGVVLSDEVVPAGEHRAIELARGDHLRIIDLEGRQAVDFLCYDLDNLEVRYNAANTIKLNQSVYIGAGFKLYSDAAECLLTVVQDTVGSHDTIGGCCSPEINRVRYGIQEPRSCRSNFIAALSPYGLGARDIPANINFFMNVPILPDGSTAIVDGLSEPGDFVDLRADKDTLAVLSNCPQRFNEANDWNPTPIRLIRWKAAQGA